MYNNYALIFFLCFKYWSNIDISKLDLFSIFQGLSCLYMYDISCYSVFTIFIIGIQFLPLDKYMYLKVLSFVNLVETTFRYN